MMKKIFLSLFAMLLICCDNKESTEVKNKIIGKTFNVTNYSNGIPFDIEFKDSIFQVYQFTNNIYPFELKKINDSLKLFLETKEYNFYKNNSNEFDFLLVGTNEKDSLKLKEKIKKWNLEDLNGKWVNEKDFNTDKFYIIKENEINYQKQSLKLSTNNTFDYINFDTPFGKNKSELFWRIISLTDNEMIIDITKRNSDSLITVENNVKLIRKTK